MACKISKANFQSEIQMLVYTKTMALVTHDLRLDNNIIHNSGNLNPIRKVRDQYHFLMDIPWVHYC